MKTILATSIDASSKALGDVVVLARPFCRFSPAAPIEAAKITLTPLKKAATLKPVEATIEATTEIKKG